MGAIPETVLDEIKRRTDLAALISRHVSLRRSGRGFVGLCPFHDEKSPSFHVDPERGFFHCFGCGAGGNAFTFVMRTTGQSFPEACRQLAEQAGVTLPDRRTDGPHDRLAQANALAAELFERVLWDSRLGEPGRAYLEQRGIPPEIARRFRLGFAPAEAWPERLERRGISQADLIQLGLASRSRRGPGLYPQFRQRLIFPIEDLSGRTIAFGGRAIEAGQQPKYLNSPETPLYRKGHHLYGLGQARDPARAKRRLLLVEGYLDVISLVAVGVTDVAAALGTAVTADQLRLARRFAEDVVVCFDGDPAGRRAALRVFPICVKEAEIWPRAAFLPAGEDPDSLARSQGAAGVEQVVAAAGPLLEVYLEDVVETCGGADRIERAAGRAAQLLAGVDDPLIRDRVVRGVAARLGVSEQALAAAARQRAQAAGAAAVARSGPPGQAGGASSPPPHGMPAGSGGGPDVAHGSRPLPGGRAGGTRPSGVDPRRFSIEAELVELMVCDAGTAARVAVESTLSTFQDAELRALGERVLEARMLRETTDASELLELLPRTLAERVHHRLATPEGASEAARAGAEWFTRREAERQRQERREWISRLRAAEARRDEAGVRAALDWLASSDEFSGE